MKAMKGFKFPALKPPMGGAAKAALSYVAQFAYHAPSKSPRPGRMQRPAGGKGPKNPTD